MKRIGFLGLELNDETKEVSVENKVIRFHIFGKCPKCKNERELNEFMLTDSCMKDNQSFTGWKYKCECGYLVQIWEGVFDSAIDSFYEAGFVE